MERNGEADRTVAERHAWQSASGEVSRINAAGQE